MYNYPCLLCIAEKYIFNFENKKYNNYQPSIITEKENFCHKLSIGSFNRFFFDNVLQLIKNIVNINY